MVLGPNFGVTADHRGRFREQGTRCILVCFSIRILMMGAGKKMCYRMPRLSALCIDPGLRVPSVEICRESVQTPNPIPKPQTPNPKSKTTNPRAQFGISPWKFKSLSPDDAPQDLRDENSRLLRSVADGQRVISEMTSQAAGLERRVLEEAAIAKNLTAQLEVKSVRPCSASRLETCLLCLSLHSRLAAHGAPNPQPERDCRKP